jgi:hypothetical protein
MGVGSIEDGNVTVSKERRSIGQRNRDIALDRVASAIERVTPALRFLIPPVLLLFGCGIVAAVVLGHAIYQRLLPFDFDDWFVFAVLMALLLVPVVLLFLFWLALTAVRELPDKLRGFPDAIVQHRTTLGAIARETRERPASPVGWFRNLGRMGKLIYNAQDDLVVYAPLLELLNPVLLLGTLLSIPAIMLQVLIATIILASRAG